MLQGLELEFHMYEYKLLHYDPGENCFAIYSIRNEPDHFDIVLQVLNHLTFASTLSHL